MSDTWTWVGSSAYFPTAWVCDCGPYTGPLGPEPPARLPAGAEEIDFLIFEPTTSDLATMTPVGDNATTSAFRSGATVAYGAGGDVPPGAIHLFVVWSPRGSMSDAPSTSPLGLVPPGYAAGAHGPVRPAGHWSDWVESPSQTATVSATAPRHAEVSAGYSQSTNFDVGAELETQRVAEAGYVWPAADPSLTEASDPSFGLIHYAALTGKTSNSVIPRTDEVTSAMRQFDARYTMPDRDLFPPDLLALRYGLDYEKDPDTGAFVEYEGSAPVSLRWQDSSVQLAVTVTAEQTVIPFGGFGSPATTPIGLPDLGVHVFAREYDSSVDAAPHWRPYGPGDAVDTLTLPVHDGEADTQTVTLHLGSVTQRDLVLVFQLDLQDATPYPLGDYPEPSGGTIHDVSQHVDVLASAVFIPDVGFSLSSLDVTYRSPRYRYWVPGPVPGSAGPALRLAQRNDGLGIVRHPRLAASTSASSSTQTGRAPRVGSPNRYS